MYRKNEQQEDARLMCQRNTDKKIKLIKQTKKTK